MAFQNACCNSVALKGWQLGCWSCLGFCCGVIQAIGSPKAVSSIMQCMSMPFAAQMLLSTYSWWKYYEYDYHFHWLSEGRHDPGIVIQLYPIHNTPREYKAKHTCSSCHPRVRRQVVASWCDRMEKKWIFCLPNLSRPLVWLPWDPILLAFVTCQDFWEILESLLRLLVSWNMDSKGEGGEACKGRRNSDKSSSGHEMKHTRQARRALTNRSLNRQNPSRTPHELWNFVSGLPLDSILQEPVPQMSSSSVQAAWTNGPSSTLSRYT